MSHFPHTLDTHLYFNSGVSESDLADAELARRPNAFKALVFSVAFRKGYLFRCYNTDGNTLTRMNLRKRYPQLHNDAD